MAQQESEEFQLRELREYKVIKANDLIQHSRFNLTTTEQKIILYLISKIRPNDNELKLYEFKIWDFCKICGITQKSGKNYFNLKTAIKNLGDKSIWIKIEDGRVETMLRWIERPYIDAKSGTIRIKLDELMKPFLLQIQEHFTQFSVYYTLPMTSRYSLRMYELFKSYEGLGSWTFEIDDLKKSMFAENYKLFGDFKRKVIDTALREINEYGDIFVTYSVIKTGRKVSQITFYIRSKTDFDERIATWEKIEGRLNKDKGDPTCQEDA